MRTLLSLIVTLVLSTAAMAEPLTIVMESYEPYQYTQAGAFKGFDVDTVRMICERAGCQANFVDVPWARATQMVKDGEADAIFSLFKTDERLEFLVYPDVHLSQERNVIITKKDAGITINNMEDLAGKTVGIVKDYSYGDDFDESTAFTKEEATNNDTLLNKLEAGRTDAAVINELVLETVAPALGLEGAFTIQPFAVSEGNMYIAFSKKKGDHASKWAQVFSEETKKLRDEGKIK